MINLIAATIYCPKRDKFIIGVDNKLPFKSAEDMARFKKLTMNEVVIMGRKTYSSIGRALPNRINILLTRTDEPAAAAFHIAKNWEEAFKISILAYPLKRNANTWIIGGGEVYRQAIDRDLPDRLYISQMNDPWEGEVEDESTIVDFPIVNADKYKAVYVEQFDDHVFKILSKTSLDVL